MPTQRRMPALVSPTQRSRVTTGKAMFVEGDGRGPWARRRRDLEALFADDMGGASTLTEFQLSLVATAGTLRLELERLEGRMSMGEPVDIDLYARVAGHFRRICETLGIERRKRDITPTLGEILREANA
jgi:hypothetical protein